MGNLQRIEEISPRCNNLHKEYWGNLKVWDHSAGAKDTFLDIKMAQTRSPDLKNKKKNGPNVCSLNVRGIRDWSKVTALLLDLLSFCIDVAAI